MMNQDEYRRISNMLNSVTDIERVAAQTGIAEELALIIFTQRITRDATRRFYVVKNQIARIASYYDKGASLVHLAERACFPPVLLAYLLFLHKGMPRKDFWKDVRHPHEIRDVRLRKEISAAIDTDIIYSPRGEEIQRERGHLGEKRLFEWLDRRDIRYMTEKDLKQLKGQYVKTPDVLFMKPMSIDGKRVSWIESKANFGDIQEIKRNLKKQLLPYVKLFGDGIVVYWFGYVSDIEPPEGVTLVDAGFFKETGPPKVVHEARPERKHGEAHTHGGESTKPGPRPSATGEYFGE
jgi:hypothetical protein